MGKPPSFGNERIAAIAATDCLALVSFNGQGRAAFQYLDMEEWRSRRSEKVHAPRLTLQ